MYINLYNIIKSPELIILKKKKNQYFVYSYHATVLIWSLPYLKRLVAGLSLLRQFFEPWPGLAGFMADKLLWSRFSSATMISTAASLSFSTALQDGRSRVQFPMVSLEFFIDTIFPPQCGPKVGSASNRNQYQGYLLRVKVAGAQR